MQIGSPANPIYYQPPVAPTGDSTPKQQSGQNVFWKASLYGKYLQNQNASIIINKQQQVAADGAKSRIAIISKEESA